MKKVYFVRHGLSVMNAQGIFSGRTETPLTAAGKQQSHHAGQELMTAGITCIVSSPMKRAIDTAVIIAEEIGFPVEAIIISELFMEREFGPLEGTTYSSTLNLDGRKDVEHSSDLILRAQQGIDFLESLRSDVVLVVSHGVVGRALRHVLHPEIAYHGTETFKNGQVVQLL